VKNLDNGADVNGATDQGRTPLLYAASKVPVNKKMPPLFLNMKRKKVDHSNQLVPVRTLIHHRKFVVSSFGTQYRYRTGTLTWKLKIEVSYLTDLEAPVRI
jgi:hypothetical protein